MRKRKLSSSNRSTHQNGRHDRDGFYATDLDWTRIFRGSAIFQHFTHVDWAATSLGPLQDWGPALRLYTTMVMTDSRPAVLYWGSEYIAIYNERYPFVIGAGHPGLLGSSFSAHFPEVWSDIGAIFQSAISGQKTVDVEDIELHLKSRYSFLEETYFVGQFVPVRGDSGEIEGIYHAVTESTNKVLNDRWRSVTDRIAAVNVRTPTADTLRDVVEVLSTNPRDISMAILFSLESSPENNVVMVRTVGSIGVDERSMPSHARLATSGAPLMSVFRRIVASGQSHVIDTSVPSSDESGFSWSTVTWQGHGEMPRDVVVVPLSDGGKTIGFYVQGTNPRRPFDKATMSKIADLARHIELKWRSSISTEEYDAALLTQRQQEDFIDTTSHELRNPLQAMMQLADDISRRSAERLHGQGDNLEEHRSILRENIESANIITVCAAQQKRVIDDILMLSRLKSDMLSIEHVAAELSKVVEQAINMTKSEALMKSVDLTWRRVDTDTFNGDVVELDPTRIVQILINLIGNAIKFTADRETRRVQVTYGLRRKLPPEIDCPFGPIKWITDRSISPPCPAAELFVYFCVEDTGTGISPEGLSRLFKRFSQATAKTHVTYGGSGLGLYICRALAEKQNGRVGVASRLGEGSAFAFYIESRISEQSLRAESAAMRTPQKSLGDSANAEQAYHILLVEDNLINQRILAKQLRQSGYTVTVANNGAEALEVLRESASWHLHSNAASDDERPVIQVCLVDWEMPVLNGLDCCRKIRDWEASKQLRGRLPILGITANVRQDQIRQALEAGMDGVLSKPFTISDLKDAMKKLDIDRGSIPHEG